MSIRRAPLSGDGGTPGRRTEGRRDEGTGDGGTGTAGGERRDGGTAGPRNGGTEERRLKGRRDEGTAGRWDRGTARRRDGGTTGRRDGGTKGRWDAAVGRSGERPCNSAASNPAQWDENQFHRNGGSLASVCALPYNTLLQARSSKDPPSRTGFSAEKSCALSFGTGALSLEWEAWELRISPLDPELHGTKSSS